MQNLSLGVLWELLKLPAGAKYLAQITPPGMQGINLLSAALFMCYTQGGRIKLLKNHTHTLRDRAEFHWVTFRGFIPHWLLVAFFAASDRLICKICAPHCDTFLSARHLTRASGACLRKRAACASIAPNVASCFVSKTNSRRSLNARESQRDDGWLFFFAHFKTLKGSQLFHTAAACMLWNSRLRERRRTR